MKESEVGGGGERATPLVEMRLRSPGNLEEAEERMGDVWVVGGGMRSMPVKHGMLATCRDPLPIP